MKQVLAVLAVMLLALPAAAQHQNNHFYVGAGLSSPTGSAGDGWNMGFHLQGGYGIPVSPQVEIVPAIGYHTFGFDDQGTSASGGGLSVLMLGADAKVAFSQTHQKTSPFFLGGLGIGSAHISDLTIPGAGTVPGDSETKLYFNIGAGLDIQSSPTMAIVVEARYINVATSGSSISFLPITVGLRF